VIAAARRTLYTLALGVAVFVAPGAFAFGLGIAPMTVELTLEPGRSQRTVLHVGNLDRERPLRLFVSAAGWSLDSDGELVLIDPIASGGEAAKWARFSPASFSLEPGETQDVRVDIAVPAQVPKTGDHRVAIIVATRLPPLAARSSGPSGVWRRYQMTSLFHVSLPPAVADPQITAVIANEAPLRTPELAISIENSGSRHARLDGELLLVDEHDQVAHRERLHGVVLDGQTRRLRVPLSDSVRALPAGEYRTQLEVRSESGAVPVHVAELPVVRLGTLEAEATPNEAPPNGSASEPALASAPAAPSAP
jgi:P pilus assembly chaperone PapD